MVFAFSFLSALILTAVMRPLAAGVGLVDIPAPTPLKVHNEPIPVVGGAAVVLAIILTGWIFGSFEISVVFAASVALSVGLADDRRPTPIRIRVLLLAATGVGVGMLLPTAIALPTVFATATWLLLLTNGMNLLDGQNGLAAGIAAISAAGIAGITDAVGELGILLAGSLCGFLVWNFPKGLVFLGNGGAYAVGAALAAVAAVAAARQGLSLVAPLALCIAVPVAEVLSTITRRWAAGAGMSGGDRFHGYDLVASRIGRTRSTLIFWALGAVAAGGAVLLRRSPAAAAVAAGLVFAASIGAGYLAGKRLRLGSSA